MFYGENVLLLYAELIRYYSKKVTIAEDIKIFDIKIYLLLHYQNLLRISKTYYKIKNVCITNKFILRN